MTLRNTVRRWRRHLFEAAGSDRYSRPALGDIDRKLERHIGLDHGFFVEAGGNDGYTQSNTYYFEALRDWTGILVEPVPGLAHECALNRRRSIVVSAALVPAGYDSATIQMDVAGLMSAVDGAFGDTSTKERHVASGLEIQQLSQTERIVVPARTLSSILDEHAGGREVDLLSLDVEGFEMEALGGLDLRRHCPRFICVETRPGAKIEELLDRHFALREVLCDWGTRRDLLFERK